jgi:hypothetical protein
MRSINAQNRISVDQDAAAHSLGRTMSHNSALLALDASERSSHASGFYGEHQQQYENARIQDDQ